MSADKTEATRLADALERITYFNGKCEERDAAVQMLRRWPDGKPVEYQILVNGGGWRRCAKHIYDVAIRTGAGTVRALYTAPPDRPVPVGPIYCVGNKVSHAYFWRRSDADAFAASAGAAVGLHVWEVQVMGRPPAESERIAERKWLDNECLDGGCQSLKWHERIAALEADRAAALRLANDLTLETQTVEEAVADLVRMVRDARARIAALEAALDAAQEALGWHASACGEDSIPDATVEALRKIEEVRK